MSYGIIHSSNDLDKFDGISIIQLNINSKLNSKCKQGIIEGLKLLQSRQNNQKDAATIMHENFDDVMKLQQVQDLLQEMENIAELTSRIKKLITPNDEKATRRQIENLFIRKFFAEYTKQFGFLFDDINFSKIYTELEDYIYGNANYRFLAPIFNLNLEEESITINDIIIRHITDQEFEEFFARSRQWYDSRFDFYNTRAEFLVETISKDYDMDKQEERIQNFLHTIGIFKLEPVQIRDLTCILPTFYPVELRSRKGIITRRGVYRTFSILSKSDIPKFRKFYSMYDRIEKPKQLQNAIKRFNYGLESLNFEDMVIDFMISLESLFSKSDGEITHKISIRIALLFGQNEFDTECLRNFIKNMYKLRSTIVHGSDLNQAFRKIHITENRIKNKLTIIARDSIIAYLCLIDNGLNSDKIIDYLDTSISNKLVREQIQQKAFFKT